MLRVKDLVERQATFGTIRIDRLLGPWYMVDEMGADRALGVMTRGAHAAMCRMPTSDDGWLTIRIAGERGQSAPHLRWPPCGAAGDDAMTLAVVLLVSLALVVMNAVFVAAEFALIATPRTSQEKKSSEGDRGALNVLGVLTSPVRQDRYIATAQLGITLASLGLGMYGEHALAEIIEAWIGGAVLAAEAAIATALSLAVLTVLHIVVGEMLPKGLALQNPEGVARVAHWRCT